VLAGMKGRTGVSLACAIVALCTATAGSARPDEAPTTQWADYSVGYTSLAVLQAAVARQDGTVVRRVPDLRIARVRMTAGSQATLSRLPGIRFVERVTRRVEAAEPALAPASGKTAAWEWQFTAAHEDTVPASVLRAASTVTIAVLDTGADVTAPDIAAKNPTVFSPRTGTADVRDFVGHGTFVAALAAGSVTNGEGIAGFGGDASLMIVRVGAGDGSITDVDEAAAITYAVDHGARIINLSFGGTSTSSIEKSALDYAAAHGVLVVAAAGNHFLSGNPAVYPAALLQPLGSNGVGGTGLAVGASTEAGARAQFSSSGSYVSLAAPGEGVFSAVSSMSPWTSYPRVTLPGSLTGLYGYASGTSFAAPEVAGAAALVMAANPLLGARDVARVLKESASGRGAWTPELGYGVLDVANAVAIAAGTHAEVAAHSVLTLGAKAGKRRVTVTAALSSFAAGVSTSARWIVIEQHRKTWTRLKTMQTRADGRVVFTLPEGRNPVALRARWAGATDLAAASSRPVTVRPQR
jgi:subtilisin family serine protease